MERTTAAVAASIPTKPIELPCIGTLFAQRRPPSVQEYLFLDTRDRNAVLTSDCHNNPTDRMAYGLGSRAEWRTGVRNSVVYSCFSAALHRCTHGQVMGWRVHSHCTATARNCRSRISLPHEVAGLLGVAMQRSPVFIHFINVGQLRRSSTCARGLTDG
jgi:hypothetical protein